MALFTAEVRKQAALVMAHGANLSVSVLGGALLGWGINHLLGGVWGYVVFVPLGFGIGVYRIYLFILRMKQREDHGKNP